MNRHYRKGDCSPKVTPKSSHPWRRPLYPAAQRLGRYSIDEETIDSRRIAQLETARARRKEAVHGQV